MSVLENFKNIPRSPYGRATGLKCNFFFFKFATKSLEKKKRGPVAPPTGDRPLSPTPGATGSPPPAGRHSLCHLSLKIQEKREGEEKKSGETLPNCVLLIYR